MKKVMINVVSLLLAPVYIIGIMLFGYIVLEFFAVMINGEGTGISFFG